jgi:hypothetical protein
VQCDAERNDQERRAERTGRGSHLKTLTMANRWTRAENRSGE